MNEADQVIRIKGLKKNFPMGLGTFTAQNGIDLQFGKGEFAGLIGPSESGKTTLLNIIGTLDSPSEGEAFLLGRSVVLADEPTSNLDAANSHNILQTMVKLNRELNTTFLFATHDEKVIGYVRRKIFLNDGMVVGNEMVGKN